jgi:hypothetical protein
LTVPEPLAVVVEPDPLGLEVELLPDPLWLELELLPDPHDATPMDVATTIASALIRLAVKAVPFI